MKRNKYKQMFFAILYLICLVFFYRLGVAITTLHNIEKPQVVVTSPNIETFFPIGRERNILKTGSVKDYQIVKDSIIADSMSKYPTYLFFSMVMADVYNYPEACYDVYKAIKDTYIIGKIPIDNESEKLMRHYLIKGKRLGNEQCKRLLAEDENSKGHRDKGS